MPLPSNVRLATLEALKRTTLAVYLDPIPSDDTLREWFERGRIPRWKANPLATHGGGPIYYSVAAVEKFFQQRILTPPFCRLPRAQLPKPRS